METSSLAHQHEPRVAECAQPGGTPCCLRACVLHGDEHGDQDRQQRRGARLAWKPSGNLGAGRGVGLSVQAWRPSCPQSLTPSPTVGWLTVVGPGSRPLPPLDAPLLSRPESPPPLSFLLRHRHEVVGWFAGAMASVPVTLQAGVVRAMSSELPKPSPGFSRRGRG